jgi:hypothetical protein
MAPISRPVNAPLFKWTFEVKTIRSNIGEALRTQEWLLTLFTVCWEIHVFVITPPTQGKITNQTSA